MKKRKIIRILVLVPLFICGLFSLKACAQVQELEQLSLDIEKLAQFKQILSDMKQGYDIINNGYGTIKSISKGTFDLHNGYLTGLLGVSPAVRNYSRVADIISCETTILSEYKSAYRSFQGSGRFSPEELTYMGAVYKNLFNESLDNLSELTTVLTEGRLRMSDDERMENIDRIDRDMQDKLSFLRFFNRQAAALQAQRQREREEDQQMQQLYGHP